MTATRAAFPGMMADEALTEMEACGTTIIKIRFDPNAVLTRAANGS
jgi:hypothetical protein